jgi:flavin-dependent dehydrogenase
MTDLIVAGGGPAGLAAAIEAISVGLSVVVIEPRKYPIDKSCGEGLMPGAVDSLMRLGVEKPAGKAFSGIRMLARGRSADGTFKGDTGLGVRRTELSRVLRDRAENVGVEFAEARIRSLEQGADWVETCGLKARWMIAADGLHSTIRRLTSAPWKTKGRPRWGIRAHFQTEPWTDRVEIYCSQHGEAYVTPVSDTSVGVAILTRTPGAFQDLLVDYPQLKDRSRGQIGPEQGAGPFPGWLEKKVHGRILFVGDAAGFLDPITGEGVRLGFDAARLAVTAIKTGQTAGYDRDWWHMARTYWRLTNGILAVRNRPILDRMLVPTLRTVPGLFDQALAVLNGNPEAPTE